MQKEKLLSQLIALAEQMSFQVREEAGDFKGGECIVERNKMIFLNKKHDTQQKIDILTRVLSRQPLDDIYLLPAIRNLLESYTSENDDR